LDPLQTAIDMAREAGALLLRLADGPLETREKGIRGDLVTVADRASERLIVERLLTAFPDSAILGEEEGARSGTSDERWIVDPLDGTTNFLHGIPHFAISIAAQEPLLDGSGWGDVIAGIVYQPITDESFWAEKARGAWLQDRRLRVSARRNLDEALIGTGIPFSNRGDAGQWMRIYQELGPRVAGIRRNGAASLDLAWVAAGRFDGFWETDLEIWDSAAGCLLVREAGGYVSDFRGRSLPVCAESVLAGNDALHSRLHKMLAGALKPG
jgi:myo-inositol-1(or 4)-monophosphatase